MHSRCVSSPIAVFLFYFLHKLQPNGVVIVPQCFVSLLPVLPTLDSNVYNLPAHL